MKKNWAWIFLGVCIAAGVICGVIFGMSGTKDNKLEENTPAVSSEGSAEPEKQDTSTTASDEIPDGESKSLTEQKDESAELVADKKIVSPSSDEDIAEAMNDAASFAWNWLWVNQYCDESKEIKKDDDMIFCPVTAPGIHSKADLKTLTRQYFDEDAAEELMGYLPWMEKDGVLYAMQVYETGGGYPTECAIWIEKQSDKQYNIRVQENVLDNSYTMHYKLENGNWVFDKPLLWPKDVTVKIQKTEDSQDGKISQSSSADDVGSCGDDLYWTYKDGTLTISGTGPIWAGGDGQYVSWLSYAQDINKVIIEDGCTSISRGVFWDYENLKEVRLPNTLTNMDRDVFAGCTSLKKIELPASLQTIGTCAFEDCSSLESVVFHGDAPELTYYSSGNYGIFGGTSATIYYPARNSTWTEEAKSQLSGGYSDVTWQEQ